MAVRIRLTRMGRKKKPFYSIVVANAEACGVGQFLEGVSTYDPCKQPAEVIVKQDRVKVWLDKGALPSDTVKSLLAKASVTE